MTPCMNVCILRSFAAVVGRTYHQSSILAWWPRRRRYLSSWGFVGAYSGPLPTRAKGPWPWNGEGPFLSSKGRTMVFGKPFCVRTGPQGYFGITNTLVRNERRTWWIILREEGGFLLHWFYIGICIWLCIVCLICKHWHSIEDEKMP